MLDAATLLIFPLLMAFAGFSDMFTMQISNRVSLLLVAAFLALAVATGMPLEAIGWHLSCGFGVLLITFTLFVIGTVIPAARFGAGDAKLMAATAVWMGWGNMMDYFVAASLLGGVLTLFIYKARSLPLPDALQRQAWIARLHNVGEGVPYGIALGAAAIMVYPSTAIWLTAILR